MKQPFISLFLCSVLAVAACGLQENADHQRSSGLPLVYTPTPPADTDAAPPDSADASSGPASLPSASASDRSSAAPTPVFTSVPSLAPLPSPLPAVSTQPPVRLPPHHPSPRPSPVPTAVPSPFFPWPPFFPTPRPTPVSTPHIGPVVIATRTPPAEPPPRSENPAPRTGDDRSGSNANSIINAPEVVKIGQGERTVVGFIAQSPAGTPMRRRAHCQFEPCVLSFHFSGPRTLTIESSQQSAGDIGVILEAVDEHDALVVFNMHVYIRARTRDERP